MIGNVLKLLRNANGHSIENLSNDLGVSESYIKSIENGEEITLAELELFAEYYRIPVNVITYISQLDDLIIKKLLKTLIPYYTVQYEHEMNLGKRAI